MQVTGVTTRDTAFRSSVSLIRKKECRRSYKLCAGRLTQYSQGAPTPEDTVDKNEPTNIMT